MNKPTVKLPMQYALNASLDMLRLRGDLTDAVVILINQRTGECKVGSLRGEVNHTTDIVSRTLSALQKQRAGKSGLITVS